MAGIMRLLALITVFMLALGTTGCDLCVLDPDAYACSAQGSRDHSEVQSARLIVDPDTIFLLSAGESGTAAIELKSTDSSYKYRLVLVNPASDLTSIVTPDTIYRDKNAAIQVTASTWPGQTQTLTLEGRGRLVTVRKSLVVLREAPFEMHPPSQSVTIQAGARTVTNFLPGVTVAPWFEGDATVTLSAPAEINASFFFQEPVTFGKLGLISSVNVSAAATVAPGVYNVALIATYRGFADTLLVPITVTGGPSPNVDFALQLPNSVLTIERPGSASTALLISHAGTTTGPVQLTHGSVAAGITLSFPVNPVTSAGSVDVGVASSVLPGLYPVQLRGTFSGETRIAVLSIRVIDPDFQLNASPATLTIPRGASQNLVLAINRLTASIRGVTLSAQNVPNGINATFANNPETRASADVTVSVGTNVAAGTYTFQIAGDALGIRRTTDVVVVVTNPPISVSLSPAALTIRAGQAGQTLLSVGGLGYMQSGVTVRVPGPLPAGIIVTVSSLPTSFSNFVVDVTTTSSLPAGIYVIPIQVIHVGVTYTTTLSLTIN